VDQSRTIDPALSTTLDFVRWSAAGLVVVGHARSLVFAPLATIPDPGAGTLAFYALTGLGHQAVIIFFVLSGFLVGGPLWAAARDARLDLRGYAAARIVRLLPVHVAALAVTALCDLVGAGLATGGGAYRDAWPEVANLVPPGFSGRTGAAVWFGNAAMLQTIVVPTYGSNGPLWSLANEFWYYVAAGLTAALALRGARAAIVTALLAALAFALPFPLVTYGALWAGGAVAYRFRVPNAALFAIGIVTCLAAVAAERAGRLPGGIIADAVLAVGVGAFFACHRAGVAPSGAALQRHLAGFSYSLYAVHMPIILLLASAGQRYGGLVVAGLPGVAAFVWFAGLVALAYGSAWLVARAVEDRGPALRGWLLRFSPGGAPRAS
jgi:peptidoglycan/LPS O-acetylase OafA/YrhL